MATRTLILMRHARQAASGLRDHENPLTPDGRADARQVGLRIRELGPIPERALVSTALRCRETWAALAEAGDLAEQVSVELMASLYNADTGDLLDALAGVEDDVRSLLLLAHNPGMSSLGMRLASARDGDVDRLQAGFTPASIACFEIDGPWSLVSPRTARLLRFDRR